MKKFSNLILENSNGKSFDKDDLLFIFAHTFDLCNKHSIEYIYFNPDSNEWVNNAFTRHDSDYILGYMLNFDHYFYGVSELEDFNKYLLIINELKSDLDRFMDIYGYDYIGFEIDDSKTISVIIKPIDYRK